MLSPPASPRKLRKLWPIQQRRTQAVAPMPSPLPAVDKALANTLLPVLLGGIAGSTDTIGFLAFGGLFTAHITGNFVVLAAHVVSHHEISAAVVLSVPVFVATILLTRWLAARLAARAAAQGCSRLFSSNACCLRAFLQCVS